MVAVATSSPSVTARSSRPPAPSRDRRIGRLWPESTPCAAPALARHRPTAGMARVWLSNWTTKPPDLPDQRWLKQPTQAHDLHPASTISPADYAAASTGTSRIAGEPSLRAKASWDSTVDGSNQRRPPGATWAKRGSIAVSQSSRSCTSRTFLLGGRISDRRSGRRQHAGSLRLRKPRPPGRARHGRYPRPRPACSSGGTRRTDRRSWDRAWACG